MKTLMINILVAVFVIGAPLAFVGVAAYDQIQQIGGSVTDVVGTLSNLGAR